MFGFGKKKETEKTAACCCGAAPEEEACCAKAEQAEGSCCPGGVMAVEVLGSGCKSCHALMENTQAAVKAMGREKDIRVDYVTDMEKIMRCGVMSLPALVVCGKIVSVGRVLRPAEIQELIEKCC